MKKSCKMLLLGTMVAVLAGCGNQNGGNQTTAASSAAPASTAPVSTAPSSDESIVTTESPSLPLTETLSDQPRILVAYFSIPETDGVDTVAGASRVVVEGELYGNTQYVAEIIAETTGGTLFRIETEQTYPGLHDPLVDFADKEKANQARPGLSSQIENLDSYDIIYLGFPNWWADMPMPMYSLLDEYDFSGKTIVPFSTHGGSGFSNTIQSITNAEPNAVVIQNGYTVSRNSVGDAKDQIVSWLEGLGL